MNLYTLIGKVFRLCLRIEPSAALFWALGNVLAHILKLVTQPEGLAWHPSTVVLAQYCTAGVS